MIPWGEIITGIVGLGGVAGSILSAKVAGESATRVARLTISAEGARAREAEKRKTYAACVAAFAEMTFAAIDHRSMYPPADRQSEKWVAKRERLAKARDAVYEATMLLHLTSDEVARQADRHRDALTSYVEATRSGMPKGESDGDDIVQSRSDLYRAMLDDLDKTGSSLELRDRSEGNSAD